MIFQSTTMDIWSVIYLALPLACFLAQAKTENFNLERQQGSGCDCGWTPMNRIIGGEETGVHEFPFMAALIYQNNLLCGASLITDRFVLSAAHCVLRHNINDMYILVGDHDITIGSDTSESALYKIGAWEIYPNYQEATQYNDIAILQSQTQILFSPNIGPVCLPFRYIHQTFNGAQVYIIGWGQMTFGGSISRVLRKTQVQVISNAQCNSSQLERIDQGEICTYYQQEAKDSCQFDSGGPVAWFDPTIKRFQLLGIISHGVPCGVLAPSINTRVTEYLQWIMDRTETNYCVK